MRLVSRLWMQEECSAGFLAPYVPITVSTTTNDERKNDSKKLVQRLNLGTIKSFLLSVASFKLKNFMSMIL